MKLKLTRLFLAGALISFSFMQDRRAPSSKFNLDNWKLQLPGPVEIKELKDYSDRHFYLTDENYMHFHLDAAEKGPTPNAVHVRAELRNLEKWKIDEDHSLSATMRVGCDSGNFRVTILQIKCQAPNEESAPPFLRIAAEGKNLYAFLKEDAHTNKGTKFLLKTGITNRFFQIDLRIRDKKLLVFADGVEVLRKEVGYWKLDNHFKMGVYPQQSFGVFDLDVKQFSVN